MNSQGTFRGLVHPLALATLLTLGGLAVTGCGSPDAVRDAAK